MSDREAGKISPHARWMWIIGLVAIAAVVLAIVMIILRPSLPTLREEARAALAKGKSRLAIEKLQQVVNRAPDSVDGWILLARAGAIASDTSIWQPAAEQVE